MNHYVNPHPKGCFWHNFTELVGPPNIKWCETTICHWASEPANTWSNIAYIIAAIVLYRWHGKSEHKELRLLAPTMLIMAIGSLTFHLSNNYVSQLFDFVGMFFFLNWLGILSWRKTLLSKALQYKLYAAWVLISSLSVHIMYMNYIKFQSLVVISVAVIILGELFAFIKGARDYKIFLIGLFIVGLAQFSSFLDANRIWCFPDNHWFQFHALQHVLSAIGLTIATKHYQKDYN